MRKQIPPIIKGFMTYIPGMYNLFGNHTTGGTDSAEYCYGTWFKHLTFLWENKVQRIPDTMIELGPGDSLGIGLAALLSGVNNYYALDVVEYVDTERNLMIFDQLVDLFKQRAGRPSRGWPDFDQYLDANLFPGHILTEDILRTALAQERIEAIRNALRNINSEGDEITIKYIAPWNDLRVVNEESVDLILSHSVLEHVTDLENAYKAFATWLKPKGYMSHQIDFTSHHLAKKWNEHWSYSELSWKIVVGRRPYLINRQPCSTHTNLIKKNGFELLCSMKRRETNGVARSKLANSWQDMSEDDFTCSGAFVQAYKIG